MRHRRQDKIQMTPRHVTAGAGAGAGRGGGSRGYRHRMLGGRPLNPPRARTQRKEGEGTHRLERTPRFLTTHVRGKGRTGITYMVFIRILDIESVSWSTPPMVGESVRFVWSGWECLCGLIDVLLSNFEHSDELLGLENHASLSNIQNISQPSPYCCA